MISPQLLRKIRSWSNAQKIEIPKNFYEFYFLEIDPSYLIDNSEVLKKHQEDEQVLEKMVDALTQNNVLEEFINELILLPVEILEALEDHPRLRKVTFKTPVKIKSLRQLLRSLPQLEEADIRNVRNFAANDELIQEFSSVLTGVSLKVPLEIDISQFPKLQRLDFSIGNESEFTQVFNQVLPSRTIQDFGKVDQSPNLLLRFKHLERRNQGKPFNPDLLKPIIWSEIVDKDELYCSQNFLTFLKRVDPFHQLQILQKERAELEPEFQDFQKKAAAGTLSRRSELSRSRKVFELYDQVYNKIAKLQYELGNIQLPDPKISAAEKEIADLTQRIQKNSVFFAEQPPKEGQIIWSNEDLESLNANTITEDVEDEISDEEILSLFDRVQALLFNVPRENLIEDVALQFDISFDEVMDIIGE